MRSAFTPGFLCLRHPASAKLGHPSPKDRLFLWDAPRGSHVEPIAEHGRTPEEVESAFDNLETSRSHVRQWLSKLVMNQLFGVRGLKSTFFWNKACLRCDMLAAEIELHSD